MQNDESPSEFKAFIDEYERIITTVGVFIALSIFWRSLGKAGLYLSFACMGITVPLLIEIAKGIWRRRGSLPAMIFMVFFIPILFGTPIALYSQYSEYSKDIIGKNIHFIVLALIVAIGAKVTSYLQTKQYSEGWVFFWEMTMALLAILAFAALSIWVVMTYHYY
jgi:hypothetical protein